MSAVSLPDKSMLAAGSGCFHCGEEIPAGTDISVRIKGAKRRMCCQGCRAVAMTINDFGLADYYRYRSDLPQKPDASSLQAGKELEVYDDPGFQKDFIRVDEDSISETSLILEGMVCPACAWLIESHLGSLAGIKRADINYTSGRALISWDAGKTRISEILAAIYNLGYRAFPYRPGKRQALREKEKKYLLLRLGIAGLFSMQVMMIAIALYAGDWQWMQMEHRQFLCWVSLLLATPVIFFSAQPFFRNTRRALKQRRPEMDVAVALGISIGFVASVAATVTGKGTVYYDSITMLVFFLLIGRYLEFSARNRASSHLDNLEKIIPAVVTRLVFNGTVHNEQTIPVNALQVGDTVLVRPGETVPVDGVITDGETTLDESIITGEAMPVSRRINSTVCCGSTNIDSPVQIRVTAAGVDTSFSRICRLIERAQSQKPAVALWIDRIAGYFISAVLLIAGAAAWYWWQTDPSMWIPVTVATLVVTCPCALSLATPVSITVAVNHLLEQGVAVIKTGILQTMGRVTHLVFDKTGTLTEGKLRLATIVPLGTLQETELVAIARALESRSEHPVARAFLDSGKKSVRLQAEQIRNYPGEGIRGYVNGNQYAIGTYAFVEKPFGDRRILQGTPGEESDHCVYLADEKEVLAAFHFTDKVRADAAATVRYFNNRDIRTLILSGDNHAAVAALAAATGINETRSRCRPDDKLAYIKELQKQDATVAMVGDGINDAPVLAGADVSIAMGSGTDLAQMNADLVLLGSRLTNLVDVDFTARRCMRIIRQNITWAVLYNLVALPAAVSGLLAPWMAAIGMSASSLLVVLNSLRINKKYSS